MIIRIPSWEFLLIKGEGGITSSDGIKGGVFLGTSSNEFLEFPLDEPHGDFGESFPKYNYSEREGFLVVVRCEVKGNVLLLGDVEVFWPCEALRDRKKSDF